MLEMVWARPTAEVNGIRGGYTGQGLQDGDRGRSLRQDLLPARAQAGSREDPGSLSPLRRSAAAGRLLGKFAAHGGSPAIQLSYDSPFLAKAKRALADEWPKPAVMIAMGGSIPVVGDFKSLLGMESLLVGFGLSDDRIHSPNEKYDLQSFHKGQRSWARILDAHQPQADRPMTIRFHRHDLPDLADYRGRAVAIDTETLGLNPHRDRLCVVQLSPGDGTADIIQIAPGQRSAPNLVALLVDPGVTKLFHYGRFDIAVLYHSFGVMPEPVFCTKIASRLTRTYTDRHGLKDICAELLGINLSKVQQSSDWAAESLTPEQLDYAASDVLYLHRLREVLSARLARESRTDRGRGLLPLPAERVPAWISPAGRMRTFSLTAERGPNCLEVSRIARVKRPPRGAPRPARAAAA